MAKKKTTEKPMDKETLRREYEELYPKYERLGNNIESVVKGIFEDNKINVLAVYNRVKEFKKFYSKIERKGYTDPFAEIEDICGLRIICYLPRDLKVITTIISEEFDVLKSEDKSDILSAEEFDYRSLHFIIKIKDDWLYAPEYEGLHGFKAEIQVRTVLMHAWADIAHKLSYNQKEAVPYLLKRRLSRLCALFEIADEQFDDLWESKLKYRFEMTEKAKENARFNEKQAMNIDSLQALLDFYFPDRVKSPDDTPALLSELSENNTTIKELVNSIELVLDCIPEIEKEYFKDDEHFLDITHLGRTGIIRLILDITNNAYWESKKLFYDENHSNYKAIIKWRRKIAEMEEK